MDTRHVDIAIIGTGTAGMAAYRRAREYTDSIALIEGGSYGTTCARVGCMPSKLLIAAAEAAHAISDAPVFGVHAGGPVHVDGRQVMARVRSERDRFVGFVIETVDGFDARHRLRGQARFLDSHRLQVGDDLIVHAERIVIAAGSRPAYPAIFEKAGDRLIINDDVFDWEDLPGSVAVFGGGIIGLELGQALHRLGVRVRLFGRSGSIGPLTDPAVRDYAAKTFMDELDFLPDATVTDIANTGDTVTVHYEDARGKTVSEEFDYLLAATGRRPNVDRLDIEKSGLSLDGRGIPLHDPYSAQCGDSHIFLAGDASNHIPLLHEAADEGRIAGENAGRYPDVRCERRRAPIGVMFSDPQIATIGQSYRDIEKSDIDFAVGEVCFEDQGRSRVINKHKGLLKVYGEHGTGRFLGAEMIAPRAEHLAHLLAWSVQQDLRVPDMLEMPYYHPVIEEGLRTALRVLNRQLKIGPEPIPRCIDCGPGA